MTAEQEHTVVAAVLQKSTRLIEVAGLSGEYFIEEGARKLYLYAIGYWRKTHRKNALDLPLARTQLERSGKAQARALLEVIGEYETYAPITDAEFRDSLLGLLNSRRKTILRDHGVEAMKAIVDKDWDAARQFMREAISRADEVSLDDDSPMDIRSPKGISLARESVEGLTQTRRIFDIGFRRITRNVSLATKELTILGGYKGDGKTQLSKAFAYNAAQNGANVLFVALEMTKIEMITIFVAQHATTLEREGVDYKTILDGTADQKTKVLYNRALDDFCLEDHDEGTDLASGGGHLHIWAPKRRPTWNGFVDRARAMKQDHGIDIIVVDYTELLKPSTRLGQYRLDLKEMFEAGKEEARDLDVWMLMLHQISRKGRDEAEKRSPRHYLMRDLGESSGVERAADHTMWIYSDQELTDDKEVKIGLASARKGRPIIHGFHAFADWSRAVVAEIDEEED